MRCKWLFGHVLGLVPAPTLHDAKSVMNDTTTFLRWRLSKWEATWHFGHVTPIASTQVSSDANGTIPFLMQRWSKWGVMWLFGHMTPLTLAWCHMMLMALSMALLHSIAQESKWCRTWYLWSHDATGACVSIQLHSLGQDDTNQVKWNFLAMCHDLHWHHKIMMALSMTTLHLLVLYNQNELQHDIFGHLILELFLFYRTCFWLSKTSFQALWALHQVWGQPNNNALI